MYIKMGGGNTLSCQSLHTYAADDQLNRFVNIGKINGSTNVFECGTIVNGVAEVNAFIRSDGTCSFINSNATTFTGLCDVPHSYQDKANKVLVVGEEENCLKFSDALKISSVESSSVVATSIETHTLDVKDTIKIDYLEVGKMMQKGGGENYFLGKTKMSDVDMDNLVSNSIQTNNGSFSGVLTVEGEAITGGITTKNLTVSNKSLLSETKTSLLQTDILEVEGQANIKSAEVKEELKVYGLLSSPQISSNEHLNTGRITTADIHSALGTVTALTVDTLTSRKITSHSETVFGMVDQPQIFLPNADRYIDVDFNMSELRGHGYGFAPTQALDTIILNVTSKELVGSLWNNDIKIGFRYYNTKDTTPTVYKVGEVLFPTDYGFKAVVKLSGNLPVAPYWVLTVEINPF